MAVWALVCGQKAYDRTRFEKLLDIGPVLKLDSWEKTAGRRADSSTIMFIPRRLYGGKQWMPAAMAILI